MAGRDGVGTALPTFLSALPQLVRLTLEGHGKDFDAVGDLPAP
jgi:hypothetical protein